MGNHGSKSVSRVVEMRDLRQRGCGFWLGSPLPSPTSRSQFLAQNTTGSGKHKKEKEIAGGRSQRQPNAAVASPFQMPGYEKTQTKNLSERTSRDV